ncbi:hypothetical protein CAC42_2122 [Sphaceloma murrayae]|uniref:Essential protein Yae1 N-terminal domain-containing protein n=1 Tax=Sphaceloma murrayae TaxID=2082308 RepID=A0A2K1QJ64_9PEZI|nr:hypothetical protein CAC42_2122 [Sphaceloma murrayae]
MAGPNNDDPFDELLSLEEQYYKEGHALGVADGAKAGRIEGRLFGMEKGFEKFAAMGALAGQCSMWTARMLQSKKEPQADASIQDSAASLPPIQHTDRLQKHIATLEALTEVESLDTQNTEEAVSDFDDRLKRAEAKAKIIASIVGDPQPGKAVDTQEAGQTQPKRNTGGNMEDFTLPKSLK